MSVLVGPREASEEERSRSQRLVSGLFKVGGGVEEQAAERAERAERSSSVLTASAAQGARSRLVAAIAEAGAGLSVANPRVLGATRDGGVELSGLLVRDASAAEPYRFVLGAGGEIEAMEPMQHRPLLPRAMKM